MICYGRHQEILCAKKAVELYGVDVRYPETPRCALAKVTLTITAGQHVAVIGQNGAGKSTLLRAIAGLLRPHAGNIRVFGVPIPCPHQVVYLPQRNAIDWSFPMSVERFVLTGCYVHLGWLRVPARADRQRADTILWQLGLSEVRHRRIDTLSGGQRQRLLVARTLLHDAPLMLLDEPLTAVDAETTMLIYDILKQLKARGRTVLVATHDLEHTDKAFDTIVTLNDGVLAVA